MSTWLGPGFCEQGIGTSVQQCHSAGHTHPLHKRLIADGDYRAKTAIRAQPGDAISHGIDRILGSKQNSHENLYEALQIAATRQS
jgi:hypothetical protein